MIESITYGRKSEKGNSENAEARCDDLPHPSSRHGISVTYCGDRYDSPPESVRIAGEVPCIFAICADSVLFSQIHEITTEDQP